MATRIRDPETLSKEELLSLHRWRIVLGTTRLCRRLGLSNEHAYTNLRRRGHVTSEIARAVRSMGAPPEEIPCPRCERGTTIRVADVPARGKQPICSLCKAEAPGGRRAADARYRKRKRGRARGKAPSYSPCPKCQGPRGRDGSVVYCITNRCPEGATLQKAKPCPPSSSS